MHPPQGVSPPRPGQVCKLLKSLYGLKQASRRWFEKLISLLLTIGFVQASADHSFLIRASPTSFTALLIYVNDIILAGDCLAAFAEIKQLLDHHFRIKDLG